MIDEFHGEIPHKLKVFIENETEGCDISNSRGVLLTSQVS